MNIFFARIKARPSWLVAALLAAACLFLAVKAQRTTTALRTCDRENADLRSQLDVANMAPLIHSQRQVEPGLSEFDLRRLQRKGLPNPVFDLMQDLARRDDLIPAEAFFGGTMYIIPGEVYVLTDRWVLAGFEDGHARGNLWLEYDVREDGQISWRVLDWYLN